MTELAYDKELEGKRIAAHNERKAAEYAILCDLSGVYDSENIDLYLRGAAELQATPGLADTLFEGFSPKPPQQKKHKPTYSFKRLTRKQLLSLDLGHLMNMWRELHPNNPQVPSFDPGQDCTTNNTRRKVYADAIYRLFHPR